LLKRASSDNGIAHFWVHPENLAYSPDTAILLEIILREVARLRETNQIEVLTQFDYCQRQRAAQMSLGAENETAVTVHDTGEGPPGHLRA
jgi:hypothetical protein